MKKILFQCRECGGDVFDCRKDGRFYEHRNIIILLPEHFSIPRCTKCNLDWFTDQLIKDLEVVLEAEYLKHADLINSIIQLNQHRAQK